MTTQINEKEKNMLLEIFKHPQFTMVMPEEFQAQLESLQAKLVKKKIDKKAQLATHTIGRLTFKMDKGNGSMLAIYEKQEPQEFSSKPYSVSFTPQDKLDLFAYFYSIHEFYGDVLEMPYHRPYCESFNVYEKGVERTFDLNSNSFSFLCYTDEVNDDNWTRIGRAQVNEMTRMLMTYIFLHEDVASILKTLPQAVQDIYPSWVDYKVEKDEKDRSEREDYEKRNALRREEAEKRKAIRMEELRKGPSIKKRKK